MPVLLFVCTANIIRSPVAEGLFKHKLGERGMASNWIVRSAGTWGKVGLKAAQETVEILRKQGIYITSHRSRIISSAILEPVDLILTMEQDHKEALNVEFPNKNGNILLLSEMINMVFDIPDPADEKFADFDNTVSEIDSILEKGFGRIIDLGNKLSGMKKENTNDV